MPRPPRCRRICQAPQYESFSPEECPRESEAVTLTLDEYEVIRLVDLEKKTHSYMFPASIFPIPACAQRISPTTQEHTELTR